MSAIVTASKPRDRKRSIAAAAIASRVWRFLRARSPSRRRVSMCETYSTLDR